MTAGQGKKRTLTVKIISPHYHRDIALENFSEIESLIQTAGMESVIKQVQHRLNPHPATYIGPGKIAEIKKQIIEHKIDIIVLDQIVKPSQIFRLEQEFWKSHPHIRVIDKIDLILEIFDLHANSEEAKLQIELARLAHLGPRIYGTGGSLLSRQGGGTGTRGIGETNIERMRRHIKDRQAQIYKRLKSFESHREHIIHKRLNAALPSAVLVGYTNAGKSTIFKALTTKDTKIANSLFTTLEAKTGKIKTSSPACVLLTDTIGFIKDLPPELITAFRATLSEALVADLILHVIDASDQDYQEKIKITQTILETLGVADKPTLCVYNKTDRISVPPDIKKDKNSLFISALNKTDISKLREKIISSLPKFPAGV